MRPHVQIVVQHDSALQERGALLGQIGTTLLIVPLWLCGIPIGCYRPTTMCRNCLRPSSFRFVPTSCRLTNSRCTASIIFFMIFIFEVNTIPFSSARVELPDGGHTSLQAHGPLMQPPGQAITSIMRVGHLPVLAYARSAAMFFLFRSAISVPFAVSGRLPCFLRP